MYFRCSSYVFCLVFGGMLWAASPLRAKSYLVKQAMVAFEKEELSEAKKYIDTAIEEATTQAQGSVWYYRGVIYEKLLRNQVAKKEASQLFEETLNAYLKAITLTPKASQYHSFAQINLNRLWMYYLDRGGRYYRQKAFESAIQQFEYCKQIIPSNPCAYLYTAIAAHQEEKYDLALHNYTYYLTSGVEVPAAVYRGVVHLTAHVLKDAKKAIEILEQALFQHPFDNDLLHEQIQIYTSLNQVEAQIELMQKQVVTSSNEAAMRYQLGYWYEQHKQWEKALEQYQKATELIPNRIEPVRQQGIVYYNQAARLTCEIMATSEEHFEQVGVKQLKKLKDNLSQALTYFAQAIKLSPRDAFILKHLRIIYRYLHRPNLVKKIERRLYKYKL